MTSRLKAEFACSKVDLRAFEKGAIVCTPKPEARYDRILDMAGKLFRVQIKYASVTPSHATGSVQVNLQTKYGNGTRTSGYTLSEIDALLVYIPVLDKVLWIPSEIFSGKSILTLRMSPSKNNQSKGVLMTTQFEW